LNWINAGGARLPSNLDRLNPEICLIRNLEKIKVIE
jgi:hypothetical protein